MQYAPFIGISLQCFEFTLLTLKMSRLEIKFACVILISFLVIFVLLL